MSDYQSKKGPEQGQSSNDDAPAAGYTHGSEDLPQASASGRTEWDIDFAETNFHDDYEESEIVLGKGSSGEVYMCTSKSTGENFAVKFLYDFPTHRREAHFHKKASECEHVVKLIAVYKIFRARRPRIAIVMEMMTGGTLHEKIIEDQGIEEKESLKWMKQICNAVKFLHDNNIAHRDLKPTNLLLSSRDDDATLKLGDFGFAIQTHSPKSLDGPYGTQSYIAPEILRDKRYDRSCDIWSLGVTLFEMICGQPPFRAGRNRLGLTLRQRILSGVFQFNEEEWEVVSGDAKDLITAMMQSDPQKRLTIDGVLKHKWLAGPGTHQELSSSEEEPSIGPVETPSLPGPSRCQSVRILRKRKASNA